jgi:hypothetical protein
VLSRKVVHLAVHAPTVPGGRLTGLGADAGLPPRAVKHNMQGIEAMERQRTRGWRRPARLLRGGYVVPEISEFVWDAKGGTAEAMEGFRGMSEVG